MVRDLPLSGSDVHDQAARSSPFEGFWGFIPLPRTTRILLIAVIGCSLVVEGVLRVTGAVSGGVPEFASSVATNAALLLLVWRPPVAAGALLLAGLVALAFGQGAPYLTALTATIGFIVFSCSAALALAYGGGVVAWIIAFAVTPPELTTGGVITLFVLALVSTAVGRGILLVVRHNRVLRRALDHQSERLEAGLSAERDRIADELHDVVAHDLSIVAMHARVLERTDDPVARATSQRAIAEASRQALADTRRILQLIHGRGDDPAERPAIPVDVRATLDSLAEELRALGDDVRVTASEGPKLSRTIDTALVRGAREAVANIIKHAASPRVVTLTLTFPKDTVVLEVANGPHRPGTPSLASTGLGLPRLKERAELLGGEFAAGIDGDRWVARLSLPQT